MKSENQSKLEQLGLTEHEALVYQALVKHSPVSAAFLAKKCNLSRSSVYTTLNILIGKGLASTSYKNEVKQFVVGGEVALQELLQKQKENLEGKFLALESLKETLFSEMGSDLHVPDISFFEGQEGLRRVYLSMLREARSNDVLFLLRDEFVWEEEWSFIFSEDWKDRVRSLKQEKNIRTKLLVNDSPLEQEKELLYRKTQSLTYRYLKQTKMKHFAMYLLGDTAAIMSMERGNFVGIKIINESLTNNFRRVFTGLWELARHPETE